MILVEGTFWPLAVVGAIPDSAEIADPLMTVEESDLWHGADLRLALVMAGDQARVGVAQAELFGWLERHRERLWRCASRVAWIIEDEATRHSTEQWLTLIGDRLFRGEVATFRTFRSAVSWLTADAPELTDWQ